MLYTACVLVMKEVKRKMKHYYLMRNRGNDVVVPDRLDLDLYRNGVLTWEGFKSNYLTKLQDLKRLARTWC